MTNRQFDDYLALVREVKADHPEYRLGQTYFNVLCELQPEVAETYRATALDPFYRDERVAAFLSDLYSNHVR